jgi:hypothetical protein
MAVSIAGLPEQVDPHWRRGISYTLHGYNLHFLLKDNNIV